METEITLGSYVTLKKEETFVIGAIDGLKLVRGNLERISVEEMDYWFWMSDGWQIVIDQPTEEEEENGEI